MGLDIFSFLLLFSFDGFQSFTMETAITCLFHKQTAKGVKYHLRSHPTPLSNTRTVTYLYLFLMAFLPPC